MDAKTVLAASRNQFPQEDDLVVYLPNGHIEVFDPGEGAAHFIQLVVMGGEEAPAFVVFVEVLHRRPGDGQAVEGGRAPADFIEEVPAG